MFEARRGDRVSKRRPDQVGPCQTPRGFKGGHCAQACYMMHAKETMAGKNNLVQCMRAGMRVRWMDSR